MVMFTLDLCMELIREKVLICWDTFSQSTFTNFSEALREAFLPPGIELNVGASKEDYRSLMASGSGPSTGLER